MTKHYYEYKNSVLSSSTAVDVNTDTLELHKYLGYALDFSWSDDTPAAANFATTDVNTTNDTITETAHGFLTGLKGQFTTTTTLPAGLSLSTDYWVIKVDDNTYKVATSLANAQAGTQVDITDQGTGTHTFTATALSGTVKLQGSNNDSNYKDIAGSTIQLTSDTKQLYNVFNVMYRFGRAYITISSGQITINANANLKGF